MLKIFTFLLLIYAPQLLALGNLGHETVCEIAYQELTPTARKAVDDLIALETNSRYKTFSRSCRWADDKKGGRNKARSGDHYINVPRHWVSIAQAQCVSAKQCLFSALQDDEARLRSRANDHVKLVALKYFSHWVADIHQPLHVSFQDDMGGNAIKVKGIDSCENLHSLWDRCLPEASMQHLGFNRKSHQQKRAFAVRLHGMITAQEREQWLQEFNSLSWANESLQLTRQANVQYCILLDNRCQYSLTEKMYTGIQKNSKTRILTLNEDYLNRMTPIIHRRIQQAGIRLGALLNSIFDDSFSI